MIMTSTTFVCFIGDSNQTVLKLHERKVSCPGVWLCQDGRVSLSMFALGTNYQTCLLPPVFPLLFRDVFYFKKRFQESCALNNMCCLLKDETICCELVQWSEDCKSEKCTTLAQYLGAVNDILFPPNMCCNDGVDLLMRKTNHFPGILSPKIEILTKVRIDEVSQPNSIYGSTAKVTPCHCSLKEPDPSRQRQVCHSAQYHRTKCFAQKNSPISISRTSSRERQPVSRSQFRELSPKLTHVVNERPVGQKSYCSVESRTRVPCDTNPLQVKAKGKISSYRPQSPFKSRTSIPRCSTQCKYNVYTAEVPNTWHEVTSARNSEHSVFDDDLERLLIGKGNSVESLNNEDKLQRLTLESRYISDSNSQEKKISSTYVKSRITPCVCEICRRYHELFHKSKCNYSSKQS